MPNSKITIAIDGPSSCGKSTLARELAKELGYTYIDSGAMYRAVTLYFLRQNINSQNDEQVREALKDIRLTFEVPEEGGNAVIFLNEENVSQLIREMLVAEKVSQVAALHDVRAFCVSQQQALGSLKGIVMDGRDIGTVVFPDAELKVFMNADPGVRVLRRFEELHASNPAITLDEVRHNLELRDYLDSTREESPLIKAADAVVLDNSKLSRAEQLSTVLGWVRHKMLKTEIV